jgi:hypothetical protein
MAETEPAATSDISKWNALAVLADVDIAAELKIVLTRLAMGGEPGQGPPIADSQPPAASPR